MNDIDNNVLLMRYNGGVGALTLATERSCILKQLVAGTVPVFRHLLCFPATVCVRKNASCSDLRMLYSCIQSPVTMAVNTLASNRAELLKAPHIPPEGDLCVVASSSCRELLGSAGTQGLPVAGFRVHALSIIHGCLSLRRDLNLLLFTCVFREQPRRGSSK